MERPRTPTQLRAESERLRLEAKRLESEHAAKPTRPEDITKILDHLDRAHSYQEKGNLSRWQEDSLTYYIFSLERAIEEISAELDIAEVYVKRLEGKSDGCG